jgi:uncharacterized protein (DUF2267 family)
VEQTIVQLIQEKAGISEQQAQTALDTVVGFLKEKLPEPLGSQFNAVLGGNAGGGDQLGSMLGSLGGLLGKKE